MFFSSNAFSTLLFAGLSLHLQVSHVNGLGCLGSSSDPNIPTNNDLDNEGWQLIAWARPVEGMFNGNTNLHPDASYGSAPPPGTTDLTNLNDFQINYRSLLASSDVGNDILFITGDHKVWGHMHWESAWPLQAVSPFTSTSSNVCCNGGNTVWKSCEYDGLGIQKNCGHILYRPASEDPWISIANGDHFAGYNRGGQNKDTDGNNVDLMVWGEVNYVCTMKPVFNNKVLIHVYSLYQSTFYLEQGNDGVDLKNAHGGMKVYIRPRAAQAFDVDNIGNCPTCGDMCEEPIVTEVPSFMHSDSPSAVPSLSTSPSGSPSTVPSMSSSPSGSPSAGPSSTPLPPDPCRNNKCSNHGKCSTRNNAAYCTCEDTFMQTATLDNCVCPPGTKLFAEINRCYSITEAPTQTPTQKPSTLAPTETFIDPVPPSCSDSTLRMKIKINGDYKLKYCDWAGRNAVGKRCSIPTVASHCPLTCAEYGGDCEIDSLALTKIMKDDKFGIHNCAWVAEDASERCQYNGVAGTCRATCSSF